MKINEETSQVLISSQYVSLHMSENSREQRYNPEKELPLKEKTKMSFFLYVTFKNLAYQTVTREND